MYWFSVNDNDCPVSIFNIVADDFRIGWNVSQRLIVKSAVARGFAVSTEVATEGSSESVASY